MTVSNDVSVTPQPRMSIRRFLQWPARAILRLLGWQIVGQPPRIPKYVMLGVPHTSNADGFLMLLVATAVQLRLNFLIKDSWFRGPLGPLARRLGGVPIDRSTSRNTVGQIVAAFASREELAFVITPEGTRGYTDHWRSGFYHIARRANIPVVLGFIDYGSKQIGFGPAIELTSDTAADMDRIRAFYADKTARYPEKFGPIRLRREHSAEGENAPPGR